MGKISRKSIFFSIVSLLIVTMFVATTEISYNSRNQDTELDVSRTRVRILNSMVNDLENSYFEKMIYIAGKNSLEGLSGYYADNQFTYSVIRKRPDKAINDILYDTILYDEKGRFQANLSQLGFMQYNYTIKGMEEKLNELYMKKGIRIKYLNISISPVNGVTQKDPWHIEINASINYYISDEGNIASWKGFSSKKVAIPVYGMYLYDNEVSPSVKSNIGKVTSGWKYDNGTMDEASVLTKIGGLSNERGICLDYCENQ